MKMVVAAISVIGPMIATSAFAADMAVKAPPSPPVPVFSWTGPYAGLALGQTPRGPPHRFWRRPIPPLSTHPHRETTTSRDSDMADMWATTGR